MTLAKHIEFERGKRVSVPGIYANVPLADYHGDKFVDGYAISSSGLRTIFNKSPAHYWVRSPYNPQRADDDDAPQKQAFILGRAAHHLLLGQKEFAKEFVIRPDVDPITGEVWSDWKKKSAREWRDKRVKAGYTALTSKDIEVIRGVRDALAREPLIAGGLLNGYVERSIAWKDRETGVWLLSRPDTIPNDSGDFADLKVVSDVSDYSVAAMISEYGYHQQGALARETCKHVLGIPFESFNLVMVENKPPYCVRIQPIDPVDLDLGHEQNLIALRIFKRCLDTKTWPGPVPRDGQGAYFQFSDDVRTRLRYRIERYRLDLSLDAPSKGSST